jgi:hypothetical protein
MASYLFVSFLTAEWHVVDNFLILSQKPEARSQKPAAVAKALAAERSQKPASGKARDTIHPVSPGTCNFNRRDYCLI